MDVNIEKIIDFIVLQKGMVPGELEKPACDNLLQRVISYGLSIVLFLSDRHRGIRKLIRTEYPAITHEFDVWHISKSLAKLIKALSNKAPRLDDWKQSILNHLWWCSQTCGGNEDELIEKFISVLDYVKNNHSWEGNKYFH